MHPLYGKADRLSAEVIGAAIEVHRNKGPGLIESIYEIGGGKWSVRLGIHYRAVDKFEGSGFV